MGIERVDVPHESVRALSSVFSEREKRILVEVAERLPPCVTSDRLTAAGVFGAAMVAIALIASHVNPAFLWLGLFGLMVNWIGDSLDGTLARVRGTERPRYGFFVDHLSDLGSQFLIVLGLGLSPYMRFDVAVLALLGYLALSVYTLVKLQVSRTMQISYFGVGPTEIRLLIGSGLVLAALVELPRLATPAGMIGVFDAVAVLLFIFAVVAVIVMFVRDAHLLAVIDPPRHLPPREVVMQEVGGAPMRAATRDTTPSA